MSYDSERSHILNLSRSSPDEALKKLEKLKKSYSDIANLWADTGKIKMELEINTRGHSTISTLALFEKALSLENNNEDIKNSYQLCKKHQINKDFDGPIEHIVLPLPTLPKEHNESHRASMLSGTFTIKGAIAEEKLDYITINYLKGNHGSVSVGYIPPEKEFQFNKTALPIELSMREALEYLEKEDKSYVLWNMTHNEHKHFMENFGFLEKIDVDEHWLNNILSSEKIRDEFLRTTHWYQMVIGSKNAGMFNHIDGFMNAGWHLHIRGKKRWHICHPDNTSNIKKYTFDGVGEVNCYAPNYESHPDFRKVIAYMDELSSGDILYYPGKFWHQTHNVEDLNITFTCSGTNKSNIKDIVYAMKSCCYQGKPYKFSKELQNSLDDVFSYWDKKYDIDCDSIFDVTKLG